MPINNRRDFIHNTLKKALEPTQLTVIDQGWQHVGHAEEGAGHFKLIISSPKFIGLSLIDCHRLVYEALGEALNNIHALQIEIQY